jgi:general secretion pathway protein M
MELASNKMPRGALFIAFNAFALVFSTLFVVAPLISHFVGRSEDIAENSAQLAHFQSIIRNSNILVGKSPQGADPFLPGNEERIVSADLQANLKAVGTAAGVRVLGIRGLEAKRFQQMRMVTVGMDLEGSLSAIRDVIQTIENQTPALFVTEASLQSATEGDDGVIRAEIRVRGAMRENGSAASANEAISQ